MELEAQAQWAGQFKVSVTKTLSRFLVSSRVHIRISGQVSKEGIMVASAHLGSWEHSGAGTVIM